MKKRTSAERPPAGTSVIAKPPPLPNREQNYESDPGPYVTKLTKQSGSVNSFTDNTGKLNWITPASMCRTTYGQF